MILLSGFEACSRDYRSSPPQCYKNDWVTVRKAINQWDVCINLSVGGKCWKQQVCNFGNSVGLWKTCRFCLDANQETIRQSSLTEQGQDGKEVSCHHVFEEEKNERWTELCDKNLTLKPLPEFKGVVVQSHKLEASDLHGLTGVGHNLPTGQWHHWGFEENFDSSSFPPLPWSNHAVLL